LSITHALKAKETPSTVVTTLLDRTDDTDGLISLREAIAYAQEGDTITFHESLRGQTITLNGSELFIYHGITIDATGMNITLDGNNKSRVFSTHGDVTLKGLTITGGYIDAYYSGGAGIYNDGTLSVLDCTIKGKTVVDGFGG
jgi:hypothetical protein